MGTWSIEPKNDKVDINESTGEAHFDRHDYSSAYTITYSDGICGEVSREIIVYGCKEPEPSCECNVTIFNPITDSGENIEIGRYEAIGCEGEWSAVKTEGADFLSNIKFSNSKITANVSPLPEGEDSRSANYKFSIGTCSNDVDIVQQVTSRCDCTKLSATGETVPGKESSDLVLVGKFDLDRECGQQVSFEHKSGPQFIDNLGNPYKTYEITGTVIESNPGDIPREATYVIKQGDCEKEFTVTQATTGSCTCEEISSSSIYEPRDTIFDNNAHEDEIFAVYETKGCGSVSATSNSEMFSGDVKTYSYDENIQPYDTYQENAYYYMVGGSLKENTGPNRSGGVSIHLKTNGSTTWNECGQAKFYVQQRNPIYECSDVSFEVPSKTVEIAATEVNAFSQNITSVTSDYALTYEVITGKKHVDKDNTYVQRSKGESVTRDYYVFKLFPNDTGRDRRIEIRMYPYINVDFVNPITTRYTDTDWVGGAKCESPFGTFTIMQKAESVCNCDNIDASKAKIGNISGYEYPDNTFTIDSPLAGTNNITIIIDEECTSFDGVEPIITSDNTDFIPNESIEIKRYEASKHMWVASFEYTQNSGSERAATLTITFCEGNSFTATVKQVGGTCEDCENDFKNKVTVDTTVSGQCYGVSSELIKYTSMCGVDVEVEGGNPEWLEGFGESTLSGIIRLTPNIKPNFSVDSRSFVYKLKAKNLANCELGPFTYYQEGYKPCNKDNYLSDLIGITDERSGQSKDVIENTTITAGTVTIKTKKALLDCVDINLSTSQPEYVDESSLAYENIETGLTRNYEYYMKFDVVCATKSIGDKSSQAVTVDVNTFINGEDMHKSCRLNLVIKKS